MKDEIILSDKYKNIKDMTGEEASKYFTKKEWKGMQETGLLSGITGLLVNGRLVIYACDLKNAYLAYTTGIVSFVD